MRLRSLQDSAQGRSCRHGFLSSQTKRTPPHPVARIMGWFGTDDTPADAGSPVDKDTYVVTYCRN